MKKLLWIPIIALLFCLVACKDNNTNNQPQKLVISYYDNDTLIETKEYTDSVSVMKYSKTSYKFIGWYLDKELTQPFEISSVAEYYKIGSINLYAKMEKIMKRLNITIEGEISNNEYVVNPFFSWNESGNSGYVVSLLLNGEVVETGETENAYFQFNKELNKDTNYTLEVKTKDNDATGSIEFKTLADYNNTVNVITLANPYMNGMVMQRDTDNIIVGTGPMKQLITLTIDGERYFTISDEAGYFEIELASREASFDPVSINVSNGINATKELTDVLFGDVYLFAGQSNMQWGTSDSDYIDSDLDNLVSSSIRFFCQDVTTSTTKLDSVKNGRWFKPTKTNVGSFSAIATMTGSMLATSLNDKTPIGIITAYQGDTNIANWMGPEFYKGNVSTKYLHYNAMVYPLRYASIKGVVWYQGCNNSAAGCDYKQLLIDFFANYRDLFHNKNLAFFVIGLACYDGDSGNNFDFSYVRESQAAACATDRNAFFISTCDNGDPTYIHPRLKRYICERVYKSISAVFYGADYLKEGPSYKSHEVNGNKVIISLNNYEGLRSSGAIKGLYLAGSDGKYYEATATIQNEKIVASCDKVANPVYIKYGFGKSPFVNIYNKDGFAITPFRTDDLNTNIDLLDYESLDNYYFHPDGSKMVISLNNGNLAITKTADGKGYGSVRLDKWGAIIYQPQGFEFTIKGTNSGASIAIRFIEGDSYEIWGYKIVDDFTGEKKFSIGVGDLIVMYNKSNNTFEPQKIGYVEIMVETSGEASFEICSARFVSIDRTKPMNFTIANVTEGEEEVSITLAEALFANSYEVSVSDEQNNVVYSKEAESLSYAFDKSLLSVGKPYYISAKAKNELGETDAINSGYVFYLKDDQTLVVCNFDFKDNDSLQAYIDSSMSVHAGLTCSLDEKGVKIASSGQGWQQFIFKLEPGSADGMSKLQFYADFTNYKGTVVMQLCNPSYSTFNYNINLDSQKEGTFVINFNEFTSNDKTFEGQTLMWVMFNFSDSVGNGYIILDDVILTK